MSNQIEYEQALRLFNQEQNSQRTASIEADIYANQVNWPDDHLVGINGDPVPFHVAQRMGIESEMKIVALIAGTQSGKTSFGPWWLKKEIDKTASQHGENDYIVVTSSYPLFRLKLLPSFLYVFEHILGMGRFWTGDKIFELRNPKTGLFEAKKSSDRMWGRVLLLSANSLGGLESTTAKAAWLDEAGQDEFTLKAYQAIIRRLSLHRGRQLFTTTLYNLGWVKSRIIDVAKKGGKEYKHKIGEADLLHTVNEENNIELIQYDSILNPEFSLEEFEDARGSMSDDEFKMFYRGIVAKLRSIIYNCFDAETHVVPAFEIPNEWPKGLIGIDPVGQVTAALWLAFDPENNELHIYREYEEPFGKTTYGHVTEILKYCAEDGEVLKVVGGGPSENQARLDWNGSGLPVVAPSITEVWVQIGKVYALFKEGSLLVHDSCPRTISDLGMMKRKEDRHGNMTNTIEDKDTWHLLDALRYIVAWLSMGDEVQEVVYNRINIV